MYGKGAVETGEVPPGGLSLPPVSLSLAQPGHQGRQEVNWGGKGVVTPMQPALRLETPTPTFKLGLVRAKLGAGWPQLAPSELGQGAVRPPGEPASRLR